MKDLFIYFRFSLYFKIYKQKTHLISQVCFDGGRRIRTFEGRANGFTVRPLWPLGNPSKLVTNKNYYTQTPCVCQQLFSIFFIFFYFIISACTAVIWCVYCGFLDIALVCVSHAAVHCLLI